MSGIISSTASGYQLIVGMTNFCNDDVLQPITYRMTSPYTRIGRRRDVDLLWPRSSFTGNDYTTFCPPWECRHQDWEYPHVYSSGHAFPKVITGVAYAAGGTPLAGATVKLFNTATGALMQTVIADAAGNYVVSDPNNVACFVVAYMAGSPDVAGTTVNTL